MKKLLLSIILVSSFSFSQETDYEGFMNFSYNNDSGKIILEIKNLDSEFMYINSLSRGVGNNDLGLDRGQLGNSRVVYFTKRGNKILLIQPNLRYVSNSSNYLENKAVEEAFARSVLFGFDIIEKSNDSYKIDITSFLISDAHGVSQRLKYSNSGSYTLNKSMSAIDLDRTKAFPKNIEFDVLLTFTGNPLGNLVRSVTPTASNLTVNQHHSFVELPDNNYKKRKFDPRSGSNPFIVYDYSTPIDEKLEQRFIVRHRLSKKYPKQEISEPVDPIVYYIDNGTPEPVKTALIEGGNWWNQAFESAGYKDAFRIEVLPEDADPMDVRYNLIQWIHRSTRGWSYGASIVDPRTGEIIKGQVSLGSLRVRQDYMILSGLIDNPNDIENKALIKKTSLDRIRQLSAHEIGHTLGFAHNYISSANNRSSVMDYPHPKIDIIDGDINIDNAYSKNIGDWDKVTVRYAYTDFQENENEDIKLNQIIEDAVNKGLYFLSDSDSRPVGSANPFSHLWDNGEFPYKELNKLLKVRDLALKNIDLENLVDGEPYDRIEDILVPIYMLHRYQIESTAKAIGGVDYLYFVKNLNNDKVKFVNSKLQKESLESLLNVLNPKNLVLPDNLIEILSPRSFRNPRTRENFESNTGVTFDYINASSSVINHTLTFLINPERINRIYQQNMFGENILKLEDYLTIISNSIFSNKKMSLYETSINNNTSSLFLDHLFLAFNNSKTNDLSKSLILSSILNTKETLSSNLNDYNAFLVNKINGFLNNPDKYKPIEKTKIPDGSPIGDFSCDY
ncbi:zinc-dependent metalloprotease [Flavobacteriaceae bacterium]|nr:zinc-dependent metalloprotease [Flavobacteriaceae bacterium]MDB2366148.1 zinc-dependent metalloprotease [Flavobacteriaceae bacterium]|tara:strand:+ start:1215 stop:3581 length:2367 start_codon:yes stop_codon:yes gene_type:complete